MKISPINNFNLDNKQYQPKTLKKSIWEQHETSLPNGLRGQSQVYIDTVNKLKNETKEFPNDVQYRQNLMKNAGMNPNEYFKIRSIIGPQEIESIMKSNDGSANLYSNNDENIKSGLLRANLHIHTTASDGRLTVEELLDKASDYANKVASTRPEYKKEPFTIAITDHDTTESAQKAIKIIAENPVKYRNLRVILGTEFTTYNAIAPKVVNAPTNTHVLAYGIDPNEKIFRNFVDGTKEKKLQLEKYMIKDANALGKNIFDLKESQEFSNFLDKKLIGICKHMESYIKTKYVLSEIVCKNDEIKKLLKEKNLSTNPQALIKELDIYLEERYNRNKPIKPIAELPKFVDSDKFTALLSKEYNKPEHQKFLNNISKINNDYFVKMDNTSKFNAMPRFEDLYNGLKGQKNAIIGLAHPLNPVLDFKTTNEKIKFLKDFYAKFKRGCKEKAKFSEVYYQSYKQTAEKPVQDFLNLMSKTLKLFRTGSADSHGKNIFKRF